MKEYMKPELEVREIRVSENLAAATWSYNKETGAVTIHNGLISLTDAGSQIEA